MMLRLLASVGRPQDARRQVTRRVASEIGVLEGSFYGFPCFVRAAAAPEKLDERRGGIDAHGDAAAVDGQRNGHGADADR
jgi:hypothetical protein